MVSTQPLVRMLESVIFILLLAWFLMSLFLYFFQASYIYYPGKSVALTPASAGLEYEDIYLTTDDGTRINGWFIPRKNARGTMLFFHGNAGNISHRLDSLQLFHNMGLAVFIIDYRGYGNSEGSPSEKGTYMDAGAAWKFLTEEKNIAADQIVIFGRSLGGAVASWLATQHVPAALIVESAFSSTAEMGKEIYPFLPVKLITRIKYPVADNMLSIHCPVLVIHSRDDDIVPFKLGRKVYLAANEPRYFLEINGDHNQGFLQSGTVYTAGLRAYLDRYIPAIAHHEPAQPN